MTLNLGEISRDLFYLASSLCPCGTFFHLASCPAASLPTTRIRPGRNSRSK